MKTNMIEGKMFLKEKCTSLEKMNFLFNVLFAGIKSGNSNILEQISIDQVQIVAI